MKIDLCGEWTLQSTENDEIIKANVPGCVHTDLANAGKIDKSFYFRDNAENIRWIEEKNWKYTKKFTLNEKENDATLVFECLDTYADIYLNKKFVANTCDMFVEHRFNIDDKIITGENVLEVLFHSPVLMTSGSYKRSAAFTAERLYTRRMQCT